MSVKRQYKKVLSQVMGHILLLPPTFAVWYCQYLSEVVFFFYVHYMERASQRICLMKYEAIYNLIYVGHIVNVNLGEHIVNVSFTE